MPTGTIKRASPPVTIDQIRSAEAQLGVDLPADVVKHYLEVNGGIPANQWFDDGEYELDLSHFLPLVNPSPDGRSVETTRAKLLSKGLLDADLVPFALDGGGNYFCVDASGSVYYVTMDTWDDDRTPEENRAEAREKVAGSFSAFVRTLQPRPDELEDDTEE